MDKASLYKIILIISCVGSLSACTLTLNKAMQGYEKGDYIASIQVITAKLDQKQGYPRDALKKSWMNAIDLSLNQLENLPNNTLDQKLQRLEKIYQARQLVNTGFYASEFSSFVQRYPLNQIQLDIAKLYYEKGNTIGLIDTDSYRLKAEMYERGLHYTNYLDMQSLATKYRKEYSTRRAEEYYSYALGAVKAKDYKAASEYFTQALTAYGNYGDYKDARQQFLKYDKMWRAIEAERLFLQATVKEKNALYKADYRGVSSLYNEAAQIYKPYGDYKNALNLAQLARSKSMITVSYSIHQDRGEDYCGSLYSQRLSERFKSRVESKFGSYPFKLTNSYGANIQINIDYAAYFKEGRQEERNQVQSVLSAQGVENKFNQRTESKRNEYELRASVSARGDLRWDKNITKQVESEQHRIIYTGNVPDGYRDKTEGALKDRNGLCLELITAFERDMDYVFDDIVRQAMRL
ncbi:hypothetical protein RFH42_14505 [Acinetobacter rudis]|uniref:hypothetical protein n=1 Tax=Acinetobacter rudis TaxID=632955 RepID=UPI00280E45B7|nr:hypothetical protein [Acinetobacter rudis]MDQ8954159.1 hypothetical protein [Acinetobacter rudis]